MKFNTNLTFGVYHPTPAFKSIPQMSCVCDKDTMDLIACTGPAPDEESQKYAELFAAAPKLLENLEMCYDWIKTLRQDPESFEKLLDTMPKNFRGLKAIEESILQAKGVTP